MFEIQIWVVEEVTMRSWVPCETKLVAIETEDTVEGDLAAVLQTRNTKTSDLTLWREYMIN